VLIGALSWVFALFIGPWLMPGPKLPERTASDFETEIDPVPHVLALSVPDGISEKRGGPVDRAIAVRKGDTVMKVLLRAGLGRNDAHATVAALRQVYNPRDLLPGTKLILSFIALTEGDNPALSFRALRFKPNVEKIVSVARTWDNRFQADVSKTPLIRSQAGAVGVIKSSIYVDAVRAGVPVPVVVELIRVFSFGVDFQRGIRPNDKFQIFYDRLLTRDGKLAKAGDLIFAALTLKGKTMPLYRYRMKDGTVDYFNDSGESVRKTLMRTPVDGARLSSRFGRRRHPILRYTKMHRGIDFAAPRGTPIMAAGRGVVTMAGRRGSFGNYVRIRHNATYSTAYAHMKKIARGIRRGRRVRQGQIIGYVGTTGRSTGPHLHYEILRNNRQINPLRVKLPTGKKLKGAALRRFRIAKGEIDGAMSRLATQQAQAPDAGGKKTVP
jgi:murein DD-endopeptidase MepM/ murein hydrolase activator NlpD